MLAGKFNFTTLQTLLRLSFSRYGRVLVAPTSLFKQNLHSFNINRPKEVADLLRIKELAYGKLVPGELAADPKISACFRSTVRTGVLARKAGMMQYWDEKGIMHPCTVVVIDRCQVVYINPVKDSKGRVGLQVGAGLERPYQMRKFLRMHFAYNGVEPKKKLAEFRVTEDAIVPIGTELSANHFVVGQYVDVIGTSKGKGTQGAMRRWGFAGQNASHGVSKAHRKIGSVGGGRSRPQETPKGKKMAGKMGRKRVTIQSLEVLRVDAERNLLYLHGAVPGHRGSWVPPSPTYVPVEGEKQETFVSG
ncbi:50S ribosomal protein L3 [Galdieria sulphuraria]|nr:50S ribosomal protein L3 [Galdieria sulphuraria]